MRSLLCACTLLIGTGLAPASGPFPGGVLDATGRTAYLRSAGGVVAIDLAHGDVVWRRPAAHVPLLVAGDRLYAVALSPTNRLSILAFDLSSKAESVFQTDVTDLPRWVSTLDQPGKEFRFRWTRRHRVLHLTWQAQARAEGAPPKQAFGLVKIDLDSGRVQAEPPQASLPEDPVKAPHPPRQLERLAVRWHGQFGGQLVAVVQEELPGSRAGARQQRLVFRGWEIRTGKESGSREMFRGRQPIVFPDLDGKNLWLRDAGAARIPGQVERPERHHWTVFSGLDGQEMARVPFLAGTTSATVIGRRAYCLVVSARRLSPGRPATPKHTLHAIDLDTGKTVWTRPLGKE